MTTTTTTEEHFDVLIIGAGLSGIGAGYHIQSICPNKTYAILEARDAIGGTWDIFRYPGIRSDSDMYTLGYSFRPWGGAKAIADGPSILDYVRDTATEYGIDKKIRFGHRLERATWSSDAQRWTIEAKRTSSNGNGNGVEPEPVRFTCSFLFMCSGYYSYAGGYTPEYPGIERFEKSHHAVIHPQQWPEDLDYSGKRVVVIGSGATAVTLVPALAEKATKVTMLQRSPTYVVSLPAVDVVADWLKTKLSNERAYNVTKWKNVALGMAFFNYAKRFPDRAKRLLLSGVRKTLGPDFDIKTHFTPSYGPWDQRLCLIPDGDLFEALKSGRADIVTDHIDTFTETGIKLKSGKMLEADLIVTATGLCLQFAGGAELVVDGKAVDLGSRVNYKGAMLSDVPNYAMVMGYTNASWTLKADLVCEYVCRVLNHMDKKKVKQCTPRFDEEFGPKEPLINFSSGYVQRAVAHLPKQGQRAPWRLYQNYMLDLFGFRYGSVEDGILEFRA